MSRQINFLSERRKGLTKVEIQDRKIIRIASIIFGGAFTVFLIIFGVRFYFDRQLFQVKEAQKAARSQILNDQNIERSFVVFVYKLTALANLTQDKQEKNEALNFFSNLFGSDVFVTQMSYLEKERILSLKIQSDSIFTLRNAYRLLNDSSVTEEFSSVNPSDLTRNSQGDYEMVITAVVKAKPPGTIQQSVPAAPLGGGSTESAPSDQTVNQEEAPFVPGEPGTTTPPATNEPPATQSEAQTAPTTQTNETTQTNQANETFVNENPNSLPVTAPQDQSQGAPQ